MRNEKEIMRLWKENKYSELTDPERIKLIDMMEEHPELKRKGGME